MNFSVFLALSVSFLIKNVLCDKTSEKIYYDVTTHAMCFRRLNGTHQIGCSSERGGNVGVLHYIDSADEVDWLTKNGKYKPYIPMMAVNQFNKDNVDKLLSVDGLINGIIVVYVNITDETIDPFSPDASCPNADYGMYADQDEYKDCTQNVKWNAAGNSLMFRDFPFPIAALKNETEVLFLKHQCYEMFNKRSPSGQIRDYPLCAVQVKNAMDGAKDTPTCIRRSKLQLNLNPDKYCDPLGDYSVIAFNRLMNNSEAVENDSVIMAAARLDTFSMFDNIYPSADSAVSGIVTLLTAAQALSDVSKQETMPRPIMYSLFNGEAFDYIGSSRVVYEMEHDRFPYDINPATKPGPAKVGLRNLKSFVELSQVGLPENNQYFIHIDPISYSDTEVSPQIDQLIGDLNDLAPGAGVSISIADKNNPLPPASAQSFLKKDKTLPGVVIADHKESYTNKFYNSRFDIAKVMGVDYPEGLNDSQKYDYETEASKRLCDLSTLVARLLYTRSTDSTDVDHISADCSTVRHLLYCMLVSPKCELFREVLDTQDNINNLASVPYSLYVAVKPDGSTGRNPFTRLVHHILAYFTGKRIISAETKQQCDDLASASKYYGYLWMMGPVNSTSGGREGMCVENTAFYEEAKSPAFLIDDYDWTSKEYSSWTESRWAVDAFRVRAFLKPSPESELLTLLLGITIFVVSLPVIYLIDRRSTLLFRNKNSLPAMADNDSH